jgi:hypothetical protein
MEQQHLEDIMRPNPLQMAPGRCYRVVSQDDYVFEPPARSAEYFAVPDRRHLVMVSSTVSLAILTHFLQDLYVHDVAMRHELRRMRWNKHQWSIFSFASRYEELLRLRALDSACFITSNLHQFGDKEFPFVRENFRFLWAEEALDWGAYR